MVVWLIDRNENSFFVTLVDMETDFFQISFSNIAFPLNYVMMWNCETLLCTGKPVLISSSSQSHISHAQGAIVE